MPTNKQTPARPLSPYAFTCFITGATSGIGWALATHYAQHHAAKEQTLLLGLLGRRQARLDALAKQLSAYACVVTCCYAVDVCDGPAMQRAASHFVGKAGHVHAVVANAGMSRPDSFVSGDGSEAAQMMAVNVAGVIHTLAPFMPTLLRQKAGALVAVGSVAGWRGLPGKGAYCASKAALETLLGSYRAALAPAGVQVTYIAPGWVETELITENKHPMPFILPASKAAAIIAKGIAKGKNTLAFPWQMRLLKPLIKFLPNRFFPRHAMPSIIPPSTPAGRD